jgi:hypothetical protein
LIEPANPNLSTREYIERAMREHATCVTEWSAKGVDKRTLLMHPIEFHLPPDIGTLHLNSYRSATRERA